MGLLNPPTSTAKQPGPNTHVHVVCKENTGYFYNMDRTYSFKNIVSIFSALHEKKDLPTGTCTERERECISEEQLVLVHTT